METHNGLSLFHLPQPKVNKKHIKNHTFIVFSSEHKCKILVEYSKVADLTNNNVMHGIMLPCVVVQVCIHCPRATPLTRATRPACHAGNNDGSSDGADRIEIRAASGSLASHRVAPSPARRLPFQPGDGRPPAISPPHGIARRSRIIGGAGTRASARLRVRGRRTAGWWKRRRRRI